MNKADGAIVVAIDGSDPSIAALTWAYSEAQLRQRPVHVVISMYLDLNNALIVPSGYDGQVAAAREGLDDAVARKPADLDVPVTTELLTGQPAARLVDLSDDADLMVVGTRGHGGFVGLLLGSVSQHVSRYARCDVAVVGSVPPTDGSEVVAGVDRSPRDTLVLQTAFTEAAWRGVPLRVIHAWASISPAGMGFGATPVGPDETQRQQLEQHQLDELLQPWEHDHPDVKVLREVVGGHPTAVLTEASGNAQLLVVGARGGGAFAELMLGSTTTSLLHRGHCPVLIARSAAATS